MKYKIEITPLAIELLNKVKDKREQQGLRKRIEQLKFEPDKQGKRELDELYKESSGVWSKGKGERGKAVFSPFNL